MKDLLIAGFGGREAAALGIMIGREDPKARSLVLERPGTPGIPGQGPDARACRSCIVDLAGLGIFGHSPEHERQLLDFLGGRSAVLVTAAAGAWREQRLPLAGSQKLAWVGSPLRASDVMAALKTIRGNGSASQPAGQAAPAWRRAMAFAERRQARLDPGVPGPAALNGVPVDARPHRDAGAAAQPGGDGLSRLAAGIAAIGDVFPQLSASRAIQTAEVMLENRGLLELVPPGGHAGAILINPRDGWIASRLTAYAVRSLVPAPGLFDKAILQPVEADGVEQALDRGFGARRHFLHPLDDLMWELMYGDVNGAPLRRRRDVALSIVHFPNFNAIKACDDLDMRLAAICARAPVLLGTLEETFPGHRQEVRRFAAAALVSGHAVAAGVPAGAAPAIARGNAARARAGATHGFFRSLLDRLF